MKVIPRPIMAKLPANADNFPPAWCELFRVNLTCAPLLPTDNISVVEAEAGLAPSSSFATSPLRLPLTQNLD